MCSTAYGTKYSTAQHSTANKAGSCQFLSLAGARWLHAWPRCSTQATGAENRLRDTQGRILRNFQKLLSRTDPFILVLDEKRDVAYGAENLKSQRVFGGTV